jgi:outer membrane PBP1 activator LpoA protein
MKTSALTKFLFSFFLMLLLSACDDNIDNQVIPPVTAPLSAAPAIPADAVISPAAPRQIGLLLPIQGDLSNAAKAVQAGFNDAYQQNALKPIIKLYDTSQAENINALYDKAVSEGANYIVGPLDKSKVAALEHHQNMTVITLALNNPDTPFYNSNLYEFALSPTDEAAQIADAASSKGYTQALMITPQGKWGQNIARALRTQWEADGGTIAGSLTVKDGDSNLQTQINTLFENPDSTPPDNIDVIFLVVQPSLARQIKPLLNAFHAENIPVYGTSLVYSGMMSAEKDQPLNGVLFCDMPLVIAPQGQWAALRQQIVSSQAINIQRYIRLYGLGYDAALLTANFEKLHIGFSGATGYLSGNTHNVIIRKLNFATFENGLPKTIL